MSESTDIPLLQEAWANNSLVLFIGAGLSAPYQIPMWKDLVMQLLLETDTRFENFWPEYRTALAEWMTAQYSFDLLALSRVVKCFLNRKLPDSPEEVKRVFAEKVHDRLYARWKRNGGLKKWRKEQNTKTGLSELARLIKDAKSNGAGPIAIVSMNFDDLLEQELKLAGVEYHPVCEQNAARGSGLPIIHPHGFLPEDMTDANFDLVFSEDEYHQLSHAPFHWAVAEISTFLRRNPVLFVGLSMADQTLRRLLDATIPRDSSGQPSKPFRRFVLRRDYSLPQGTELANAARNIETQATKMRLKSGNKKAVKGPGGMEEAIKLMVNQGHDFDCRLFGDMGVGVLWYQNHEDIPVELAKIAGRTKTTPLNTASGTLAKRRSKRSN